MKAIRIDRFGGPEVLRLVDLPTPVPGPGEVLVRVKAAGVNFFETLVRENRYAETPVLPLVPGVEVAGFVEAVGDGVDRSLRGARVAVPLFAFGRGSGGYAEFVAVASTAVVPMPDALAFEDAVALMVQGLSAWHLVRQGRPAGKRVLVMAAAGGVGSLLVQLAGQAGARPVIAAAGSQVKLETAKGLGADAGVDYRDDAWAVRAREHSGAEGVDLVYDTVGGHLTAAAANALAPGGELVFAAVNRFSLSGHDVEGMLLRNQALRGFALLPLLAAGSVAADLATLFERTVRGRLKVLRGGSYPLAEAADAQRALEGRGTQGKVVLLP